MFWRLLRDSTSNQRGIAVVLVAVMLLVLLGLAAMALDVGEILWSRRVQQNAVDAAALAGVRELPENQALAIQTALDYAASNGFSNQSGVVVTASISTIFLPSDSIIVTATRTVAPGFRAAVFGGDIDVPAVAQAVVAKAKQPCLLWPWGIERDAMLYDPWHNDGQVVTKPFSETYGLKVILKVPDPSLVSPGNFLALDFGSGGADYAEAIKTKACPPDGPVYTEPGNLVGPTDKGIFWDNAQQGLGAIEQCSPCYDPANPEASDTVFWRVSETTDNGAPGPYTDAYGNVTTLPFGLGCPCQEEPDCGCAGPPDPEHDNPFPVVTADRCSRVGIIPILAPGTYAAFNDADSSVKDQGKFEVTIVDYAAFYLIGMEKVGSQGYVVGAFLKRVQMNYPPDWDKDLQGPRVYGLWR